MIVLVQQRTLLVLILVKKERQNFPRVSITVVLIFICLLIEKESRSLMIIKNINFPTQFCIGNMSNKYEAFESE